MSHAGVLKEDVVIWYMPGQERPSAYAHSAYILNSGWLRVTWTDGRTTLVSPAAVREVQGKGVEYA